MIVFIINGHDQPVSDEHRHKPLRAMRNYALSATGNTGRPFDSWEVRTVMEGTLLDVEQTANELGLADDARLFVTLDVFYESKERQKKIDVATEALRAENAALTARLDEALGALAATVEQRSPCCGCAIRCGRCGNETRFVVSGHDALAAVRSQRDAHAHTARVRREALLDAAERLAETFPAQAVTQADWMGGRHDQHAADVAWLRARAEEK